MLYDAEKILFSKSKYMISLHHHQQQQHHHTSLLKLSMKQVVCGYDIAYNESLRHRRSWPAMRPMFAHQPGAASFSESTGQPGQSKFQLCRPSGTTAAEWTTRTYVLLVGKVQYNWARRNMTRDKWQTWAGDGRQSTRTPPQREAEADLGL